MFMQYLNQNSFQVILVKNDVPKGQNMKSYLGLRTL